MIAGADRVGWVLAACSAVLVHGALAYAATMIPVPVPPPPVAVEIELIDLGGGLAIQPSSETSLIRGLTPQAVMTPQQPVAANVAVATTTPLQSVQPVAANPVQAQSAQAVAAATAVGPNQAASVVAGTPPTSLPAATATANIAANADRSTNTALAASVAVVGATASTVTALPLAGSSQVAVVAPTAVAPAPSASTAMPAATPLATAVPAPASAVVSGATQPVVGATPMTVSTGSAATATVTSAVAAPVGGTAISPVASVAPAQSTSPVLAPVPIAEPAQPATIETASLPEPASIPELPVPTRGDLVQLIESFASDECFSAVPVQSADNGLTIESLAIASDDNDRLRDAVIAAFGEQVPVQGATISPEQCRALSFLDRSSGTVGQTVRLGLDNRGIASGTTLTGLLDNTAGRVVHLLIVDDEGRIQAANAYVENVGDDSRFEIPVVVTGAGANKSQILFAVVADERLQTAAEASDVPADKFFDALEFELIVKGLEADLSVASFTVE